MANTLTNLIPSIYAALDVVSRELVGVIPSVTVDATTARAAVGQTVYSHVAPAVTAEDITPGVNPPNTGDQAIGTVALTMQKSRAVPIKWNGEEQRGINTGPMVQPIFRDQVAQGFRTLVNEIEVDLVAEARKHASRAYGTPGTAPFGTSGDLSDSAETIRILEENGAAGLERSLIMSTAAMSNIRGKQSVLFKVNEAGTDQLLRMGVLGMLQGSQVRQSAALTSVTPGTGANYQLNGAHSAGATVINVDTGTGTVLAGDVVTIGSYKYVVVAALSGGAFTIGAPGLKAAHADNTAVTLASAFTPSLHFAKNSLVLATRAPALPDGGDSADDRMTIVDPLTGLSFEMALYRMYRQVRYELSIAWGVKGVKDEHAALLLG